jgi:hypothetical protein
MPLSSFCRTEKSVVPSAAGTTIDDRAADADVPGVGGHFLEPVCPVVAAAGVDPHLGVLQVHLLAVTVEFDLVNPALAGGHSLN